MDRIERDDSGTAVRVVRESATECAVFDLGRLFDCAAGHRFVSYKPVRQCAQCQMPAVQRPEDSTLARLLVEHPGLKFDAD